MADNDIHAAEQASPKGVVTTRMWDVAALEAADPQWSNRPREERHALLQSPSAYPCSPEAEGTTTNLVVDNYLEQLAAGNNPQPTHLALGDGTTTPQASNDALNNEVYRSIVGDDEADVRDRLTSTFISQNEANGLTLAEIGFADAGVDENWTLLTHTVLPSSDQYSKHSQMVIIYNYDLLWRRVS